MKEIDLPDLVLGPIRYPIGMAYKLLRPASIVEVVKTDEVPLSPRRNTRRYTLSNGDRIIETTRSKTTVPPNVDGVIRIMADGTRKWVYHKDTEILAKRAEEHGLKSLAEEAADSWNGNFQYKSEGDSPEDVGLRPPQIGALFSIGAHWSLSSQTATIVMPTGTGKTETMLATVTAHGLSNVVISVPGKALRNQTASKFKNLGLLRYLGVLPESVENPVVGVVTKRPKALSDLTIFEDCNVIIGTISSLAGAKQTNFAKEIAERSSVLFLDEAHHVSATTWTALREAFSDKRILQFTATPFRRDGKLVDGRVIFSYPLKAAQDDGYFKPITFEPVHELDSAKADLAIATKAIETLQADIENGFDHLVMARCSSISRANDVLNIYQALCPEYEPLVIHSEMSDLENRIGHIKSGSSKIAICVNMLGEGFDLPRLKIAAVHDLHKSLAVLLQFVGRFTRTSGGQLGDATVVANIADANVSAALERLYSEDSDWNELLSEMSSEAAKDHSAMVHFLSKSVSLTDDDQEIPGISHHLLRPGFSSLFFRADEFRPKRFFESLSASFEIAKVWLNEESETLFFVTRTHDNVKWTRSKELVDAEWHLFVIHYDRANSVLCVSSSFKASNFGDMAASVGAIEQISGEVIFRSLGDIGRLVFNNLGVSKHGRRNLSYAMYTGADVKRALGEAEKSGSRKSNLTGHGWEYGRQVTIGCSYKGRVWSRSAGTIPKFIEWAQNVASKLVDNSIDTKDIIDNVLIPVVATGVPDTTVMGIEWPVELLNKPEDAISVAVGSVTYPMYSLDIECTQVDRTANRVFFCLKSAGVETSICELFLQVGGLNGFEVKCVSSPPPILKIGRNTEVLLEDYLSDYPPLIRFVDLSELDGNLILSPANPFELTISSDRFEVWDWSDVDITKESIRKGGIERRDSIQWAVAEKYKAGGYSIVFDDDGAGEAADLVCLKEESDCIRVALIHCKYSGEASSGLRVKDIVEVSSQAIRSAKWPGRFRRLIEHLKSRNSHGSSRFFHGAVSELTRLGKMERFKEVRPEIIIVQPGLSKAKMTDDQRIVLAAACDYLKQTLAIDLDVICSK